MNLSSTGKFAGTERTRLRMGRLGVLAGLCLVAATVLVGDRPAYASSAPVISAVGSLVTVNGTGDASLAVSPHAVGNAFVLGVKVNNSAISAASVTGGGATWTKLTSANDATQVRDIELWLGTVTTSGSSTIKVTYSGSVSSTSTELAAQEYTSSAGSSTTWTKDVVSSVDTTSNSTALTFPTLTPSGTAELYVGYNREDNTSSAGSTSGVTYQITSLSNVYIYDPNVSSTLSPKATQSPAGLSLSVGALIEAS